MARIMAKTCTEPAEAACSARCARNCDWTIAMRLEASGSGEDDADAIAHEDVGIAEAREQEKCAERREQMKVQEHEGEGAADIDGHHQGGGAGGGDDSQRGHDRSRAA